MQQVADLQRECSVLLRYLCGQAPDGYFLSKYAAAHATTDVFQPHDLFDVWLLRIACVAPSVARICDAYARLFVPMGALRRKTVLVLGLAESIPAYQKIVAADGAGLMVTLAALAASCTVGALHTLAGIALVGPVHIVARAADGRRE